MQFFGLFSFAHGQIILKKHRKRFRTILNQTKNQFFIQNSGKNLIFCVWNHGITFFTENINCTVLFTLSVVYVYSTTVDARLTHSYGISNQHWSPKVWWLCVGIWTAWTVRMRRSASGVSHCKYMYGKSGYLFLFHTIRWKTQTKTLSSCCSLRSSRCR